MTVAPHLVHVFPTFDACGPQVRTAALINHFGTRYRHTIAALDRRTGARDLIAPGLDVGVLGPPEATWFHPGRYGRLREWLRLLQPDLLLTYGFEPLELSLGNRWRPVAPQIHHEDGHDDDDRRWHRLQLRRLLLPAVDGVVVPSHALERIARRIWRLPPERLQVIPNGIDPEPFAAAPDAGAIPGLERQPGEVVVGAAACIHRPASFAWLLRTFARVATGDTARLVIVGDGAGRGDLVRAIIEHELEGRVVLPGDIIPHERFLGHFDIFALQSKARYMAPELMEAMAAGLPVIGADVADAKSVVSEPNRDFIVSAANAAALAARLDALLRDGQLRMRLGRANREKALATFGFDPVAAGYRQLYEDVLAGVPPTCRGTGASGMRHIDA